MFSIPISHVIPALFYFTDVYADHPDRLSAVLPKLMALSNVVNNEIKYEEQLMQLLGTMDAILSMSHNPKQITTDISETEKSVDITQSVPDLGIIAC